MDEPNAAQSLNPWTRLTLRIRNRFHSGVQNASETRIRRRRVLVSFLTKRLSWLRLGLFFAGYLWMIIIPSPRLGRGTYIDENALQPGQVNTYWSWADVHAADGYLAKLEGLRDENSTSEKRAHLLATEFRNLGISASVQNYTFLANTGQRHGTNAYGILSSPRGSGSEAMVIGASWLSRTGEGDGTLNLRGVATILALAGFLKRYSLWAKDIVFIVSDGYLEGMHAWLAAYHGSVQSNIYADPLTLTSGVIWTALNIDYPGHSFSHLGIFFEGLNGRLPNQDLLNSFQRISQGYTGGVPVVVYDHTDTLGGLAAILPHWIPTFISKNSYIQAYVYQAKNIVRQFGYQASGRASGIHGLYHQFRIDAFTLFAVPATGPHGFHAIGRIVESTLRTTNNLLERLHASFFFYILSGPDRFLKVGSYLPSCILISVAMMFGGLRAWVDAGWIPRNRVPEKPASGVQWTRRRRPLLGVLVIMLITHSCGTLLFSVVTRPWFIKYQRILSPPVFFFFSSAPLLALLVPSRPRAQNISSLSDVLKSTNLCFASTVISVTTVLNFPLAASLAILLGIPLSISSPGVSLPVRLTKYAGYAVLGLGWLLFGQKEILKSIWNWEILSVWFAPFVCIVYVPLVLQAGLVCLLPPS